MSFILLVEDKTLIDADRIVAVQAEDATDAQPAHIAIAFDESSGLTDLRTSSVTFEEFGQSFVVAMNRVTEVIVHCPLPRKFVPGNITDTDK